MGVWSDKRSNVNKQGGKKLVTFLGGVLEGLFRAEAADPAVRRAVRVVEMALVSAGMVYLRSKGFAV